jgi:two-component system, response regulator FlrC
VVSIPLPALRERPQDIPLLAEFFVKRYAELNGMALRLLTPEATEKLKRHSWGGNVRELENAMHRAVLVATGPAIGPEAIMLTPARPEDAGHPGESAGERAASIAGLVGRTVAEVEKELILDTLSHCLGNRTHAANILGISIRTLRNKLKLYADAGIPIPMPGDSDRAAL